MRLDLSHGRDGHTVPSMGQELDGNGTSPSEQWPATTAYALGSSVSQARIALERADDARWAAETTQMIVREQAVAALSEAGLTVRQIADVTSLSKSSVGRSRRGIRGWALNSSSGPAVCAGIQAAWAP